MTRPLVRVALALVAVVAIAWCAILLRDSLLISRASRIATDSRATPGELRHGVALARRAKLLNPDRSLPLSWEAELYLLEGRTAAATQVYERMVREEPKFAEAWFLLATRTSDPRRAAQARAQVKRLDPLDRGASGG